MERTKKVMEKRFWGIVVAIATSLFLVFSFNKVFAQEEDAGENTKESKRPLVVVGKFNNISNAPDELFTRLRTRITNEIVNTRKFEVLEREDIENIISERDLARRGLTKQKDYMNEELESAEYSIYGDVLFLGFDRASGTVGEVTASRQVANVEIQLKISNLATGKILASKVISEKATKSSIASSGTSVGGNLSDALIEEAIRRASLSIVNELMELAYPIKILSVQGNNVYINIPKERAKIYDIYEVYKTGEELVDPDTGESLGASEVLVGRIKIIDIKPKYSIAEPVGKTNIEELEKDMIVRPVNKEKEAIDKREIEEKRRREFESRF